MTANHRRSTWFGSWLRPAFLSASVLLSACIMSGKDIGTEISPVTPISTGAYIDVVNGNRIQIDQKNGKYIKIESDGKEGQSFKLFKLRPEDQYYVVYLSDITSYVFAIIREDVVILCAPNMNADTVKKHIPPDLQDAGAPAAIGYSIRKPEKTLPFLRAVLDSRQGKDGISFSMVSVYKKV